MTGPERKSIPEIRQLGPADLNDVIALHHAVRAQMPVGTVAFETDAFFAEHMEACGRIFGCHDGSRLIAYGVLGLPRPGDANFGQDHDLSPDQLIRVAHLDGAAVSPSFRGLGIQRALCERRIEEARRQGRSIVLSTVSPDNIASLKSLQACGLSIGRKVQKFGGTRYLMRLDLK